MATLKALEKSLNILSLFTKESPTMTIQEIATLTGLPESTAYRYVAALRAQGLIEEDTKPGYYCLGLKLLKLARSVKRETIVDVALPIMERLSRATGETVILCCIYDQKGICLEKVESRHTLRVCYERGTTFYLHAGSSGKVLMAYLGEEEQNAIIQEVGLVKLTGHTITDPAQLKLDLAKIKENGFSVTDGEATVGIRAISAPIFNQTGRILASIGVGGPIDRMAGPLTKKAITLTIEAARTITQKLAACES